MSAPKDFPRTALAVDATSLPRAGNEAPHGSQGHGVDLATARPSQSVHEPAPPTTAEPDGAEPVGGLHSPSRRRRLDLFRPGETAAGGLAAPVATRAPAGVWSGLRPRLGRFLPRLAGAFGLRRFWRAPEACPDIVRLRTKRLVRLAPLTGAMTLDPALVTILSGRGTGGAR